MNSVPDQGSSHEMRVFAINGTSFWVDVAGVVRICASGVLFVKLALFSAVVAMFNPPMFGLELPLWGTFLYWLAICYVVTGLWILQFWMVAVLSRLTGQDMPVLAPLIVGAAIVGTVWINYAVTEAMFDVPPVTMWQIWGQALRYFLIAMVIELITVLLVLPRFDHVMFERPTAEAENSAPQAPPTDTDVPQVLVVNGRSIPLGRLLWMKSVEHYVEFHSDTDTLTERAPLRDMVAQAQGADGIQPHRSWWVSRRAVTRMMRKNGNPVLILTDDTEVPVSRHRKAEVEAWLTGAADGNKKA